VLMLVGVALGGVAGGASGSSGGRSSSDASLTAEWIQTFVGGQIEELLPEAGLLSGLADRIKRKLTSLIPSPVEDIGWTLRELPPPRANATAAFYAALADVQANRHSQHLSSEYVYVLVPGLLSHYSPGYFRNSLERLRDLGLDARYLGLDCSTDASSEKNAARLRLALANVHKGAGRRKLVIIAHSKGLLDTLLALSLFPELLKTVHALVSLQAPFGGAAIADDIASRSDESSELLEKLLSRVSLGLNSVRDMTYEERRKALRAHGLPYAPQAGAPPAIRVVSLASRAPRLGALALTHQYLLRKHGAANDGLVCVADALLPGSLAVVMDEADHGLPVLPGLPGARLRGQDVVEAVLTVALTPELSMPLEPWDAQLALALVP